MGLAFFGAVLQTMIAGVVVKEETSKLDDSNSHKRSLVIPVIVPASGATGVIVVIRLVVTVTIRK